MKNLLKGYIIKDEYHAGNPSSLQEGIVLQARGRTPIWERVHAEFPHNMVVEFRGGIENDFLLHVMATVLEFWELLDAPCVVNIACRSGLQSGTVTNIDSRWFWRVVEWTRAGRRRCCLIVSFRTESDHVHAYCGYKRGNSSVPDKDKWPDLFERNFNSTLGFRCKKKSAPDAIEQKLASTGSDEPVVGNFMSMLNENRNGIHVSCTTDWYDGYAATKATEVFVQR